MASALLALGTPSARAAGLDPAGGSVVQVQYRQDQYGQGRGRDDYRRDEGRRDEGRRDDYRRDDSRRGQDRGYDDRRGGGGGPGGSYQQSCENVQQNGSTLSAVCRDGRGGRFESTIDLNRCRGADISNNGGFLRCGNVQGNGRGRVN